ncbi:hypothetical protein BH20ACT5_BH20ACT5_03630 [soil metagenome]
MRLLLVEDEERISAFLSKGLRARGYAVDWAPTGTKALERLTVPDPPYDVVVLDLGLPDIDGLEVLRRIRARGNAVPVIIVTARSGEEHLARSRELGADDYLVKPFPFRDFLASLERSGAAV